jgi:hypothetical protein
VGAHGLQDLGFGDSEPGAGVCKARMKRCE